MYRIRVDLVNGLDADQIIEPCGPVLTGVIVRHELPHGNPHLHIYVHNDVKENTLRQRFKRKLNTLKPTDFSIKKCDPNRVNEYVQYMFNTKHGNKWELVNTINFDDQLLNDLIQNAKKISDDYTTVTKSKKNTGPTIWELAQELEHKFLQLKFAERDADRIVIYTDLAIDIMRSHRKPFDEFLLRKLITTAQSASMKGKEILRYKMLKYFNNI